MAIINTPHTAPKQSVNSSKTYTLKPEEKKMLNLVLIRKEIQFQ
jgi:hypothetical protein